jgi:hypothetical protein
MQSSAALVGENVRITHWYPERDSIFQGRDTEVTVVAGDADAFSWGGLNINVEDDSILFTKIISSQYATGSGTQPCNCILVSEIDGMLIGSISLLSTFGGIDETDIEFTESSLLVDFSGRSGPYGAILEVQLNPVPLPSALFLFASAIGGFGFMSRYRLNRQNVQRV